jgi:hypothetical protein
MIGAAYASAFLPATAGRWGPWLMAIGTASLVVSMMVMGAARPQGIGWLWAPFAFVFVVLAGGFCLALWLSPAEPGTPDLWFGLPIRAAIILYGVGLLPLLAVPVAYALTFDRMTLTADDLIRVREMKARMDEAAAGEIDG